MRFNVNIGTFIPKPHTPFQWAAQLGREEAEKKLYFLRNKLKSQGHKAGIQDPLISVIEGIASRGDERAGELFEEAYRRGCRFDAWPEYLKRETWEELLNKHEDKVKEILGEKNPAVTLPWECINPLIGGSFFLKELDKSHRGENTSRCNSECTTGCAVCGREVEIVENAKQSDEGNYQSSAPECLNINETKPENKKTDPATFRILFSFSKQLSAVFHPHLTMLEIFSMAFIRAAIPVLYTRGFNPLPRLEIASALSLGLKARGEIAVIDTTEYLEAEKFKERLNASLPEGLSIEETMNVFIPSGAKKHSLSSLLWGYKYSGIDGKVESVCAKDEKKYRETQTGRTGSIYDLERLSVLARPDGSGNCSGLSYFDLYRRLYPS